MSLTQPLQNVGRASIQARTGDEDQGFACIFFCQLLSVIVARLSLTDRGAGSLHRSHSMHKPQGLLKCWNLLVGSKQSETTETFQCGTHQSSARHRGDR